MLNVACFVQSCLTDADFVIFSNYCLIGTRLTRSVFSFYRRPGRCCPQFCGFSPSDRMPSVSRMRPFSTISS